MKYAVYGAGSLGLIFSAYLARAGESFDLIDRNPKSVEVIRNNGVTVTGKASFSQPVNCLLDSEVSDEYDIVFLFTKQIGNAETIKKISGFLKPDGVICTMQNGLPEKDVAEVIGMHRTYGACVGMGATRLDYGVSELTSEPDMESMFFNVGSLDGHWDDKLYEIIRILNIVGKTMDESNFIGSRWSKLMINSAFSGMSVVTGGTFGEAAKNRKSRKIIQAILKECIDVAEAAGIKCEPIQGKDVVKLMNYKNRFKKWISYMIIPLAIKAHSDTKSSMLQDYEKGIPCEIDYINGVVSEYGRKYGVPTPMNDKVVDIVHKFGKGGLRPSFGNVRFFE